MTPFRYALVLTSFVVVLVACSRPASLPEVAPSNVEARGVGGAANVTWTVPAESPRAPTDAATVQVRRDDAAAWQDATLTPDAIPSPTSRSASSWTPFQGEGDDTVTRVTVSSLTDFTAYRFRAALTNEAGRGPWSDASPVATATMPPTWPEEDLAAGDVRFTRDDEALTFARCRDDGSLLITAPRPDDVKDDPTLDCDDTDPEVRPFETFQADARLDVALTARDADGRLIDVAAGEGVLHVPSDGSLTVTAAPFESGTVVEVWREGDDRPLVLLSVDGDGVASGVVPLNGVVDEGTQELLLRGRMPVGSVAALHAAFTVLEGTDAPALLDVDIVQDDVTIDVEAETTLSLTTVFVGDGGDAVRWSSLQPDVATVDEAGVVRGVGAGTATIRVEGVDDANRFDEATIRVRGVTGVTITMPAIPTKPKSVSETFGVIREDQTVPLSADVAALHGADDAVTWRSSNENIVTIDNQGNVTGISAGDVTITAASVATPTVLDTLDLRVVASGGAAWTFQDGTPHDDIPAGMALTADGSAVIVGESRRIGASDAFALRVSPNGLLMGETFEEPNLTDATLKAFTDIVPMSDGSFVLTGFEQGGSIFQAMLTRLNADIGVFTEEVLLPEAPQPSFATAVKAAEGDGIIVFGTVSSTDTSGPSTMASAWRLDADLSLTASRSDVSHAGGGESPSDIQLGFNDGLWDEDGEGFVGVGSRANSELSPSEVSGFYAVAAEDSFAEPQPLGLSAPSVSGSNATAVTRMLDGRVAIVGYEEGQDFGDERTAFLHTVDPDTGVSRTDALGTSADNAVPRDVTVLPNGDLVVVGQADDPLGDPEVSGKPPAGFVAIVEVPADGAPIIKRSWMVALGYEASLEAVAVRDDGWLVLAGYTDGGLGGEDRGGRELFVQLSAP